MTLCHHATMMRCYYGTMPSCRDATMSPCHHVTMPPYSHGNIMIKVVVTSHDITIPSYKISCHHATMPPCHHATMPRFYHTIMQTCNIMWKPSPWLWHLHLNYNILPTKTMSSSAHSVRGMDGSFSVTTTRKEVGKTSRMFTQVSVKQIGGCCAFRFRFRAVWDGSENLVTRAD